MKPDDLDDWMDAVAGRRADAEGRLLGEALRREAAVREAQAVQPPSAAQLQSAAEAAGLVGRLGCRVCQALARLWAAVPAPRLAAALALAGLLFVVLPRAPEPEPVPVLRGAQGTQLLQDADPLARRERLALQLQVQGVKLTRYERFGRAGLRAELDAAQRVALAPLLAAEGLAVPGDGVLDVEIEAPR